MLSNGVQVPALFKDFSNKERDYFIFFALNHPKELSLHANPGKLWEKDEKGNDWSNVTEHCLVEAARVQILAQLLGLPKLVRKDLVSAACVHDFYKKEDIRRTKEDIASGGSGREGVFIAEEESERILRDARFPDLVISLSGCVSGDPKDVYWMQAILDRPHASPEEIAHLVMHYVDQYTRGSGWAEPRACRADKVINDIDRRNEMNASNPVYKKLNEEGRTLNERHPFFRGMTRFEAAATVSHLIEQRFAKLIRACGADVGDPLDIPEFVDRCIREKIY